MSPLAHLVDDIATKIREGGSEFISSEHAKQIVSLESLKPAEIETLNMSAQIISEQLRHSFESLVDGGQSLGFNNMTSAQLEAGVMIAMAAKNPALYARAGYTNQVKSLDGSPTVSFESSGIAGNLDYRSEHSLEAFDNRVLSEMIPYSIVFNVQAACQDEFSETFYPTVVVSPDFGGMDITIDRTTVFNSVTHNPNGKTTDWNQRNLVEAVADASILADESTALIPFFRDGEANDFFVAPGIITPTFFKVGTVSVKTNPLKVGPEIDLLGISQHPGLFGAGIIDHTDTIDNRIFIKNLYMSATNVLDATDVTLFKFNVARLPRNAFNKSVEGRGREMDLNFRSSALVLDGETVGTDGDLPDILALVRANSLTVRLNLSVSGHANVEFGTVQITGAIVNIEKITDEDRKEISLTEGVGLEITRELAKLQIFGFDPSARRTNSNRRTRGLLLNNIRETERFEIPLGAPISAPSPIGSDRDTRDLDSLIAAARIRNSNNAMTTLLNYADTLRAYVENRRLGHGHPVIEGIGRHLVVPFYEEIDLDLVSSMNNIKSKDRAEDINAVFINAIRDVIYRMYRISGYQAAMDASSSGGKKPTLLVGTDNIIQRHLMVTGDSRTFGVGFEDVKIVTSLDARIDNKIVLALTRGGVNGQVDPLGFGCMAWIPELTSSIVVQRDGATYQEAMVQPRSRHINNLPIMAVINVTGLSDVMTSKN